MSRRPIAVCAATLLIAGLVGCDNNKTTTARNAESHHRSTATVDRSTDRDRGQQAMMMDSRMTAAQMAFPTGERGSSVLLVQKRVPAQIRAGQPFEYEITVTNLTDQPLDQVVVYDRLPAGVAIRRADPQPAPVVQRTTTTTTQGRYATAGHTRPQAGGLGEGGHTQDQFIVHTGRAGEVYANPGDADRYAPGAVPGGEITGERRDGVVPGGGRTVTTTERRETATRAADTRDNSRLYAANIIQPGQADIGGEWRIGHLNPKETRTLRVLGTADETGLLQSCTTVSYMPALCMATEVIRPQIRVERIAPAEVSACEDVTIRYRVTNVGTGTASGIRVMETLPEGLARDAQRDVAFTVDSLGEGQSREFTTTLRPERAGRIIGKAVATDAGGLRVESAESTTVVKAPDLEVSVSAPEVAYASVPVDYRLRVTNRGSGVARNVSVRQSVGAGARLANATLGGRQQGSDIVWTIPALNPGESREIVATLEGGNEGVNRTTVRAEALCAREVSATIQTRIEALSALLLEVVDTNDPVQVGREAVYAIKVTNQGNKADTNIRLTVTLPDELEFASAPGNIKPEGMAGGAAPGANTRQLVFVIPSLGAKQSQTVNLNAKALKPGDVRFRVEMNSDNLKGQPVIETESTKLF